VPLVTEQVLPLTGSVPSNWNVPVTVVLVNEVIFIVPVSAMYSLDVPERKRASPAPLAMSKLPTAKLPGIVTLTVVVLLKLPIICNAFMLDNPDMFEVVLNAVPLNFKEILLLTFGWLSLFLHEFNVKVNKAKAKNAHFNDFIILGL
jgi:hypothetical protein